MPRMAHNRYIEPVIDHRIVEELRSEDVNNNIRFHNFRPSIDSELLEEIGSFVYEISGSSINISIMFKDTSKFNKTLLSVPVASGNDLLGTLDYLNNLLIMRDNPVPLEPEVSVAEILANLDANSTSKTSIDDLINTDVPEEIQTELSFENGGRFNQ